MWRTRADRLAAEIERDWPDRLSRVRVHPSLTRRKNGWVGRAFDGHTGKPFTWAMWRDWLAWKSRQAGRAQ